MDMDSAATVEIPKIIRSNIKVHEQFDSAAALLGPEAKHERLVVTDGKGRLKELSATWVPCHRHNPNETDRKLYVAHSGHVSCTSRNMVDDCRSGGFGVAGAKVAMDIQRLPWTWAERDLLDEGIALGRCPRRASGSCHKRTCLWCGVQWMRRVAAHVLSMAEHLSHESIGVDRRAKVLRSLRDEGKGFVVIPYGEKVVCVWTEDEDPSGCRLADERHLEDCEDLLENLDRSTYAPGRMVWSDSWRPPFS